MAKGRGKIAGCGKPKLGSAKKLAEKVEQWPGVTKIFYGQIGRAGKHPDRSVRPGPNSGCLSVSVYEGPSKMDLTVYADDLDLVRNRFAKMGWVIA